MSQECILSILGGLSETNPPFDIRYSTVRCLGSWRFSRTAMCCFKHFSPNGQRTTHNGLGLFAEIFHISG